MARLVVVVSFLAACSQPNPRSCSDGLCTDQAFPFCDIEGTLGGSENECIAVDCDAGTFRACRGDTAIICNNTGNDFNLVDCPLGCDAMTGCKVCATDAECSNPAPICDDGCRACQADDECPSRVCDEGSCASETGILYASATGSGTATCTLQDPCSPGHAVTLASMAAPVPTIRLLPGVYVMGLSVSATTPTPLRFVAAGASLTNVGDALNISGGANVAIRGVELVSQDTALSCGVNSATRSKLEVTDATFTAGGQGSKLITAENCDMSIIAAELQSVQSNGAALALGTDASMLGDRLHITGTQPSVALIGTGVHLALTNSIVENASVQFITFDSSGAGSGALFAFNTFVLTSSGSGIVCQPNSGSAHRTVKFENNVMFAMGTGSASVVDGNDCALVNNVMTPMPGAPSGNIVADPQFVNLGTRDFHLLATSPAVNAGDPLLSIPSDHDFENTMRPQGAAPDIGAFEQ